MINKLIKDKKIEIFFQPIVSIKDEKIFAYEALTRAYDENNEFISPLYLFDKAEKENLSYELDNHVRKLALLKFKKYSIENKDVLLFINFESSTIDNDASEDFFSIVSEYNISPSRIVIEVKEDRIKDTQTLEKFVLKHKEQGFIIALDDFGTGYSSFDRLALIKPDIVKIDRSIISNVYNNFINAEILMAISNMCHKIGAMVLGEGVESRDEVIECMKKDIDIFQGFWFCKPQKEIDKFIEDDILESIAYVGNRYKKMLQQRIDKKSKLLQESKLLTQKVLSILEKNTIHNMNLINDVIKDNTKLEAIYMIDEHKATQMGRTLINSRKRHLYTPSKDGDNHSMKEYYFIAKESSKGEYLSSKYISKASGNMCRTYSEKIVLNNYKYIVCFDILD